MQAFILTLCGLVNNQYIVVGPSQLGQIATSSIDVVKITMKDAGKEVNLKVGQTLVVELPFYGSNGYKWVVSKCDRRALKEAGKARLNPERIPVAPGGEEPWVQKFVVKERAKFDLILKAIRPFDPDAEPSSTFKVKVVIE